MAMIDELERSGNRLFRWRSFVPLVLLLTSCAPRPARIRDARWAQALAQPGLSNLHSVTPSLYRSAQPRSAGIAGLKKLGVKTIVNLRGSHSDGVLLQGSGITEIRIPISTTRMSQSDVIRALKVIIDPARAPVLVHCRHGADRTGTVCAAYRVVVQGWSKDDAIDEMKHGKYKYHSIFRNLPRLIERLDVAAIRSELALPPAADAPNPNLE